MLTWRHLSCSAGTAESAVPTGQGEKTRAGETRYHEK